MTTKRCPTCERQFDASEAFCSNDGTALEPWRGSDPGVGRLVLGRYRLVRRLGAGGMGVVYAAEQVGLGRVVAVKLLRADRLGDEEAHVRFWREARAVSRLRGPHTVRIFDFGEEVGGELVLVMEHLEGRTLREHLRERGRLSEAEVVGLLREVAEALGEAHAAGVVHRDVKPENVFVEDAPSGRRVARVLDFGVAWIEADEGQALTSTSQVPGTPAYVSPERVAGEAVDARSDVYALGVMAYELLVGQPPFVAGTAWEVLSAHLGGEPAPFPAEIQVSEGLQALVWRCLAKAPALRPSDGAELGAALEALAGGEPQAWALTTGCATRPVQEPKRRHARIWAVAGLGSALAAVTAIGIGAAGGAARDEVGEGARAIPFPVVVVVGAVDAGQESGAQDEDEAARERGDGAAEAIAEPQAAPAVEASGDAEAAGAAPKSTPRSGAKPSERGGREPPEVPSAAERIRRLLD